MSIKIGHSLVLFFFTKSQYLWRAINENFVKTDIFVTTNIQRMVWIKGNPKHFFALLRKLPLIWISYMTTDQRNKFIWTST